jgi:hypothetical protein
MWIPLKKRKVGDIYASMFGGYPGGMRCWAVRILDCLPETESRFVLKMQKPPISISVTPDKKVGCIGPSG